ncbi:MAG: TonB-dependent receptor, partial [Sediminibacterium sp.]|nr:TonB-dependent receptor [Sediminibacterium sp.]
INNWAKISAGISYINSFANEKSNGNVFYSPINSIWITNNIYDINKRDGLGNLLSVEPSRVNPLSTIEDMNFTQEVNRTINNLQLTLTPIKNLTFDWIIGIDYYNQAGRSFIKPYPYQSVANLPLERYPNGFAANATNSVLLYNNDINVSYLYEITNDFKLNAIAGFSYQFSKSEFVRASGEGLAPFIETVSGATNNFGVGYGLDKYDLSGVFGQATFSFKNLAFITGAIRQDKSSKFSINQSTQTYPKFSGSFILSDLKFYKNSSIKDIINSIKLRSSWGQAGNLAGIGSYDRFWQYNPISYLGKNTIIPSSALANQDVRPEKTTEFEYGFDLSFLNSKINVIANFYNQQIADLVVNRTLASTSGGLSIVNNVGEMENKGIELMLQVNPIKSNNFNWEFSIIYSSNTNKIIKLGTPSIAISNAAGAPVYLFEGQPASVFYGTFYARDANGNFILTPQGFTQTQKGTQLATTPLSYTTSTTTDAFGHIGGSEVRKIIGNPNPSYTSSFSNSLTYRNLTFSFLIDMVQGVSVFNADKRTRQGVGIGDLAEKEYKGLVPRGTIYSIYLNEEWRIDDGSFIKLREVSLSYNLKVLKSKFIKNASISLIGRNLISWDNYNGYDPETNAGGNNDILRGVDFGNVPIPKTYRLQFNLNF